MIETPIHMKTLMLLIAITMLSGCKKDKCPAVVVPPKKEDPVGEVHQVPDSGATALFLFISIATLSILRKNDSKE